MGYLPQIFHRPEHQLPKDLPYCSLTRSKVQAGQIESERDETHDTGGKSWILVTLQGRQF